MTRRSTKNTEKQEERERKLAELIAALQPSPAVLALPREPTRSQKVWWNPFIGDPFKKAVASKGKKVDNAVTWVRALFIEKFCEAKCKDLNDTERDHYYQMIGDRFYQYLANHTSTGTTGVQEKEETQKSRAYGYKVWARDHPEEFERVKANYLAANPDAPRGVGNRTLMSALFKLLPEDERERYTMQAREELLASQETSPLTGQQRKRYNNNIRRRLKTLFKEIGHRVGARVNAQLLVQDDAGNFTIHSVASEDLQEFQASEQNARALHAFKDWLGEHSDIKVQGGAPAITVYADASQGMFPRLPNYVGISVLEAQKLLRLYVNLVWMFLGGVGKVPWEEVSTVLKKWIDPDRMPTGAVWKDPGKLTFAEVLVWLEYFTACQEGRIPPEKRFQFQLVYAGIRVIAPGLSQESGRARKRRADKDMWMLSFKQTVTKCHRPGGMNYPEASKAYAEFLATGGMVLDDIPPRPEWLGLPSGSSAPTCLIDDELKAAIMKHADELPEDARELVNKLIDTTNEHQSHHPASNASGPWADKSIPPALLPPTRPVDLLAALRELVLNFWVDKLYFQPPSDSGHSTISFFERWQQKLLTTEGVLCHEPSGTLQGGHAGVVWVVITLLKLVLNFAALRDDIPRPVELPEGYDATRMPLGEWDRLLGWCRNWIARLESDVQILGKTSEDRRQSLNVQPPVPSASEPALPSPTPPPTQTPKRGSKSRSSTKNKAGSKSKGKAPAKKKSRKSKQLDSEDEAVESGASDSDEDSREDEDNDDDDDDDEDPEGEKEKDETDGGSHDGGDTLDGWTDQDDGSFMPLPPPPLPPKPTTSSSSRPTPSVPHVFGNFPELPKFKKSAVIPGSPRDILAGLTKCDHDIQAVLRAWYKLGETSNNSNADDAKIVAAGSTSVPPEYRPLLDFVQTSILAFNRSAELAPLVFQSSYDLRMLTRESVPAIGAAHELQRRVQNMSWAMREGSDSEAEVDLPPELSSIKEQESRVNRGLAEARWLENDLRALELASSEWAAKLANVWPPTIIPEDLSSLVELATPLLDWAEASEKVCTSAVNGRKDLWRQLGVPLDEARARTQTLPWYRFGSPNAGGQVVALRECLNAAKAAVVSSRLVSTNGTANSSRAVSVIESTETPHSTNPSATGTNTGGTTPIDRLPANTTGLPDPPASNPPASDPPASDPPASDPPASDPPASDPSRDDQEEDKADTVTEPEPKPPKNAKRRKPPQTKKQPSKPPAPGARGRKSNEPQTDTVVDTTAGPSTRSKTKAPEPPALNTRNGTKRQAAGNPGGGAGSGPKRRKK